MTLSSIGLNKSYWNLKELLSGVSDKKEVGRYALDLTTFQQDKLTEIESSYEPYEEDFLDFLEYGKEVVVAAYEIQVVQDTNTTKFEKSLDTTIQYLIEEKEGELLND